MNDSQMSLTAKKLDTFANVAGKIAAGLGIACIVIAFFTLFFSSKMFADGSITLDLDFIKLYLNDNTYVDEKYMKLYVFAATLGGGIICFLIYYLSKLCKKILAPMKEGRPFEEGIAENLKKIGWGIFVGGFLKELTGVVSRILLSKAYSLEELFTSSAISKTEFIYTINFSFVIITCIVFFLSYIFTYGQALQQDSDETL